MYDTYFQPIIGMSGRVGYSTRPSPLSDIYNYYILPNNICKMEYVIPFSFI